MEIEILNGSDDGIAANGAEKRESERAQQGPLRCAMAGSLSPGFVGLSKAEAGGGTPQNVKSPIFSKKCSTGQRHIERANVRAKASQDKAKQSKGGAKINKKNTKFGACERNGKRELTASTDRDPFRNAPVGHHKAEFSPRSLAAGPSSIDSSTARRSPSKSKRAKQDHCSYRRRLFCWLAVEAIALVEGCLAPLL